MKKPTKVQLSDAFTDEENLPDVHLEVLGVQVDLPNLNSRELPLGLVSAALEFTAQDGNPDKGLRQFIDFLERTQPALWAKLETEPNGTGWLIGIIEAWAEQSAIDPKA